MTATCRFPILQPALLRKATPTELGTLSPNPWDLALSRQNVAGGRLAPPIIPAARSALRSHPCVAVSSAQVCSVYIKLKSKRLVIEETRFLVDTAR